MFIAVTINLAIDESEDEKKSFRYKVCMYIKM